VVSTGMTGSREGFTGTDTRREAKGALAQSTRAVGIKGVILQRGL
jgi:hypothetical protein